MEKVWDGEKRGFIKNEVHFHYLKTQPMPIEKNVHTKKKHLLKVTLPSVIPQWSKELAIFCHSSREWNLGIFSRLTCTPHFTHPFDDVPWSSTHQCTSESCNTKVMVYMKTQFACGRGNWRFDFTIKNIWEKIQPPWYKALKNLLPVNLVLCKPCTCIMWREHDIMRNYGLVNVNTLYHGHYSSWFSLIPSTMEILILMKNCLPHFNVTWLVPMFPLAPFYSPLHLSSHLCMNGWFTCLVT